MVNSVASTVAFPFLAPTDYANTYAQDLNSFLAGNSNLTPAEQITAENPAEPLQLIPIANLQTVYAMPYDPNAADMFANIPSQSAPSKFNWKIWVAIGLILLGVAIFRHKIGKTIDKLV